MRASKVDFALLLHDDFDGSPINDANVMFTCEGRVVAPIKKKEGFYVFRGLDRPEICIEIIRPHYHKKRKYIIKNRLDPGYPVVWARLKRRYPGNFSDCEWLRVDCPPGSEVVAATEEEGLRVGSLEQDETGARLSLLGYGTDKLFGRRFSLKPETEESFIIGRMLSPGIYRINRAPEAACQSGAPLFRKYISESGGDGECFIPVEPGRKGGTLRAAYREGASGKWVCASVLEPG